MFPIFSRNKMSDAPETKPALAKAPDAHPLDGLTGGAFSAATSGERAARIRATVQVVSGPKGTTVELILPVTSTVTTMNG